MFGRVVLSILPSVQVKEIDHIPVVGQFAVLADHRLPAGLFYGELFQHHSVLVHREHPVAAARVDLSEYGAAFIIIAEIPVVAFKHVVDAGIGNHGGLIHIEPTPVGLVKNIVFVAIIQGAVAAGSTENTLNPLLHHFTGITTGNVRIPVQGPVFGEFDIYFHRTVDFDSSKH